MGSPLFRGRSGFQDLELFVDPELGLSLTLDGFWQFDALTEGCFHAMLADLPATRAARLNRALVLGGGDALALRNLLRYPGLEALTLVELDPLVLELAKENPQFAALNEHALSDPRVEAIAMDARDFISRSANSAAHFDLIIADFPAPTSPELDSLFSASMFQDMLNLGHSETVLCVQVSLDPPDFWVVHDALASVCPHVEGFLARVDAHEASADPTHESWANFLLASPHPLCSRRDTKNTKGWFGPGPDTRRIKGRSEVAFQTEAYGDAPHYSEDDLRWRDSVRGSMD